METYSAGVSLTGDGRYTITLVGELDIGSRDAMRELVDACVETGAMAVEFDMRGVTFCGAECAGIIVYAARHDGVDVSVRPSPCVTRTLSIVGVDEIVRIVSE